MTPDEALAKVERDAQYRRIYNRALQRAHYELAKMYPTDFKLLMAKHRQAALLEEEQKLK